MDLNKKIGKPLRELRQEKNMSQGDIAKKLDVHRSYISGIERGVRNPTVKNIEKIAEALRVSPHTLLQ